jgi:allantoicase
VVPDPRLLAAGPVDLAALEAGGTVVGCSDMFYGSPGNLILPGMARTMGEGWETARRRGEGNDWVLIRLAGPGRIRLAELDTSHFKGNAPGAAALRGAGDSTDLENPATWLDLLPRTELRPDTRHRFLVPSGPVVTHVRLDVYPDGGMARLRLFGQLQDLDALVLRWFNALPLAQAVDVASACDVDPPCADRLARSRPLTEVPAVLRVPS